MPSRLGLRVENSYDGSAKFRIVLMAFVLSCTNGLMSPRYFSTYALKHTAAQGFDLKEAVSVIQNGVASLEEIAPRIATLSKIRLNLKTLATVAKNVSLPNRDWGPIVQNLGNAHTLWDLMQEMTHRLTYNGRGRALITTSEAGRRLLPGQPRGQTRRLSLIQGSQKSSRPSGLIPYCPLLKGQSNHAHDLRDPFGA